MAQEIIFFASDLDISVFVYAKPCQMYFLLELDTQINFVFIPKCSKYQNDYSVILHFHFSFLQALFPFSCQRGVCWDCTQNLSYRKHVSTIGINIFYFVKLPHFQIF